MIPHLRGGDKGSKGSEVAPSGPGSGLGQEPGRNFNPDQQVMSVKEGGDSFC